MLKKSNQLVMIKTAQDVDYNVDPKQWNIWVHVGIEE